MRIPALALAAAFAGGILLGRMIPQAPQHLTRGFLLPFFAGIVLLLLSTIYLTLRDRLWYAAMVSLICWMGLGALAMVIASLPLPAEHILTRIAAGEIGLKTPLRWYGRLSHRVCRGETEWSWSFRAWKRRPECCLWLVGCG
jgi:hypothetical protein